MLKLSSVWELLVSPKLIKGILIEELEMIELYFKIIKGIPFGMTFSFFSVSSSFIRKKFNFTNDACFSSIRRNVPW